MAYAFFQLQMAIKAVDSADNQRVGLGRAFNKLSALRMKDLPAEAREDFAYLTGRMWADQWNKISPEDVRKHVASLTNAEIAVAISKIIGIRDAVAYYQPLPRQAAATKRPHVFDVQV
jgi:hypothetical protein